MDEAKQIQLALLKQLHEQGLLDEAQYRAQVAALQGDTTAFDQRGRQYVAFVAAVSTAITGF